MSVQRIQEGLSDCCQGVKETVVAAAAWGARTCQTGFQYASESASKVAEWIRPFFEAAKQFAQDNPTTVMVVTGIAAASAVLGAIFSKLCCQDSNETPNQRQQRV